MYWLGVESRTTWSVNITELYDDVIMMSYNIILQSRREKTEKIRKREMRWNTEYTQYFTNSFFNGFRSKYM